MRDLRNLGPATEAWLRAAGIRTPADLERMGPAEAYCRLARATPGRLTVVALWALAGALLDLDFRALPPELKVHLRRQVASRLATRRTPAPGCARRVRR